MAGIRIHHPTLTNCTLLLPHPGDPASGRKAKDYHLRLDANGDTIVSTTVWERIQEAKRAGFDPGFVMVNTVEKPPDLVLSDRVASGASRRVRMFEDKVLRDVVPDGATYKVVNAPKSGRK